MLSNIKSFFGFEDYETDLNENNNLNQEELSNPAKKKSPASRPTLLQSQQHNRKTIPLFEIKVEEPRIYEDSLTIAAQLRNNTPVIVNLKYLDKEASKRLVDFICGTAYAINGHMMKIGEDIFLFTPAQVNIVNSESNQNLDCESSEANDSTVIFKKTVNI
eukprot:COSAG01_NODE_12419_length_1743_cov_1.565085_2_plen_161_part_00